MNNTILQPEFLDTFMPMHVLYDSEGIILHIGPTLEKMRRCVPFVGSSLSDIFSIHDDGRGTGEGPVPHHAKLYIKFRTGIPTQLKGMAMPVRQSDLSVLNLSFGISIVDAVADYRFTAGDFAHTDLAIEMLYLVEAKSAVLHETKQLNLRLQSARFAAEEQASTDMLTGLRNRRAFDQAFEEFLRRRTTFALMHLDLDYFKSVNDSLGHAAGDAVLREVAKIMNEETREEDVIARIGGDEFVFLLKNLTSPDRLLNMARRLIARLEEPIPFHDAFCRISGSVGIATTEQYRHPTAEKMSHDADLALYSSKRGGRALATMFDPELHSGV
ncbi:GGDEF domain-containing protein [Celeribacter litoreus]|uniref:GGDEF domain-containing protein n=1 Tax=Celeribacter litoreus TaxID=2876714 RepID=UPI001CCC88FE|nr:GGDEF domain-containing protein [Celeribacter litoreus]MCA0043000.1 GGDEF domain-containing protein [Celeribacter litoreus]